MGLRTRASDEFVSVLKRLVALLPRMSNEDEDRVFDFVHRAEQSHRPLELIFGAEQLLSKYDPQFALEKRGDAIESRLKDLENAKKLREGLKRLEINERRVEDTHSVPVNQWWGQPR